MIQTNRATESFQSKLLPETLLIFCRETTERTHLRQDEINIIAKVLN